MAHLKLNTKWPHRERWVDSIEWNSLSMVEPNAVRGTGKLWWGFRSDTAGVLRDEIFQAELRLLKAKRLNLQYMLRFESRGALYDIRNASQQ